MLNKNNSVCINSKHIKYILISYLSSFSKFTIPNVLILLILPIIF